MKFAPVASTFIFLWSIALFASTNDLKQGSLSHEEFYTSELKILTGEKKVPADVASMGHGDLITQRYKGKSKKLSRAYIHWFIQKYTGVLPTLESTPEGGTNIYIDIPGSSRSNEIVLLGAHYDTFGPTAGANDNGTRVATVLSALRNFSESGLKPKRTLRFMFFDLEEAGMIGSEEHFENARNKGEAIELFVNIDMIGNSPQGVRSFCYYNENGDANTEMLLQHSKKLATQNKWKVDEQGGFMSDNLNASEVGIPSISFFEDPLDKKGRELPYDKYNHTKRDTFDRVNTTYAAELAKIIETVAFEAANSDVSFGYDRNWKPSKRLAQDNRKKMEDWEGEWEEEQEEIKERVEKEQDAKDPLRNDYEKILKILSGESEFKLTNNKKKNRISNRFSPFNMALIRQYFIDFFHKVGFDGVQKEVFKLNAGSMLHRQSTRGENYSAEIKGKSHPNEVVVIGAHYDSRGKIAGANDNGSGVAAVLAIAQTLKEMNFHPERTLRFVLFDAEELGGRRGSSFHLDQSLVRGSDIKLFINLDMIGNYPYDTKKRYVSHDPANFPKITDLIKKVNLENSLGFEIDLWAEGYRSDNASGSSRNIPSVAIFEDPRDLEGKKLPYHPVNHTKGDIFGEVNLDVATEITRLVGTIAIEASTSKNSYGNKNDKASKPKKSGPDLVDRVLKTHRCSSIFM